MVSGPQGFLGRLAQNGALGVEMEVPADRVLLALTMELARHTSKVTALRCCFSRLMAGWEISRYWLSKTMKMGFLESSSSLHSPSLRDRHVAGGRKPLRLLSWERAVAAPT